MKHRERLRNCKLSPRLRQGASPPFASSASLPGESKCPSNGSRVAAYWSHSVTIHTILQYFTLKFQKSTDLSTRSAPNRSDFRLVRLFCLDIKLDSIFPNSINHQIVTLGEEYFTLTAESCSIVGKQGLP